MLVPHSERKIFNFQLTVFSLAFLGLLISVVFIGFFTLSTHFSGTERLLSRHAESLEASEASLEVMRDELAELQKVAKVFESTLNNTLGVLGIRDAQGLSTGGARGDLSSFFDVEEVQHGTMREISEIQSMRAYLKNVVEPLNEIGNLLVAQKDLLVDTPTRWPLKDARGRMTQAFGPAEHPIYGNWYLHKGLDIALGRGIPIVATASGKVVKVEFDALGFGWYVQIRHKYGFYTKYAHLDKVLARKGQEVNQGEVIGLMGSTGLSTGPHLHYEVQLGTQVVDPAKFLNLSSNLSGLSNIK
jgi:murein DD-endopeptidase MepM/ murein hydrolase activator NlpD